MYAAACSSASGNPPIASASSSAAPRSASPVRATKNSAAISTASSGMCTAQPGGQCWFWLVITTRPGPAGGMNASTEARSAALSSTTSHPAACRASTACTEATGSRGSTISRAPSCTASKPNSAASTAGSSAENCQHIPVPPRCRYANSTATLVLPAPPSPHNATTRGPGRPGSGANRASRSPSRGSRPARNRARRQSHRQARRLRPLLVGKRPDRSPARGSDHRARALNKIAGSGYGWTGSGGVGFPGTVTFPCTTPAASAPPDAEMLTSRPAASE